MWEIVALFHGKKRAALKVINVSGIITDTSYPRDQSCCTEKVYNGQFEFKIAEQ